MKNISKRTLVITAIVLLLGGGIAYGWYQQSQNTLDNGEQQTVSEEQAEDQGVQDEQVQEDTSQEPNNSQQSSNQPQDKKIRPDEDSGSNGSIETPEVTRAEQSGDNIRVSAIFDNSSTGTCKLVLSRPGHSNVTRTVEIIVGPSYYACDGFRVSVSELPAKGEWQAKVIHQRNGSSATSETKTIKVE